MQRCSKCILAEDFPRISFDGNGVCNYCHAWDKKWKHFDYDKAEKELISIFNAARSKNRQYDCMIPFSGGRDSSYVAYLCKTKYKLSPLLVTFNNLFMSDFAFHNIIKTADILGLDHVMVTYKPDLLKKFYRAMIKDGGEFCSVCTAGINYVKIIYQKIYKIPLLISGTSTRVDEQSPFEVTSTHPTYMRKVLHKNGFTLRDVDDFLIKRHYELPALEKIKMKLYDSDYIQINLPDYVPWDNQEIQNVLEHELDWETPDKKADHIDCKFAPIKYYLKNKQIPNFIFKQEKYSQLIRDGQMTREEALSALEAHKLTEHEEPTEMKEFVDFFGLEHRDIENPDKKSHLDYITRDDLEHKEDVLYRMLSIPWKVYKKISS